MTNTDPTVNQYYTVGDISFIQEQFNAIEIPEEGDVWTFQNIVDELSRILAELNDLVGSPTSGAPQAGDYIYLKSKVAENLYLTANPVSKKLTTAETLNHRAVWKAKKPPKLPKLSPPTRPQPVAVLKRKTLLSSAFTKRICLTPVLTTSPSTKTSAQYSTPPTPAKPLVSPWATDSDNSTPTTKSKRKPKPSPPEGVKSRKMKRYSQPDLQVIEMHLEDCQMQATSNADTIVFNHSPEYPDEELTQRAGNPTSQSIWDQD